MRRAIPVLFGVLLLGGNILRAIPAYDHVVVVVCENHGYAEIKRANASFINSVLRPQAADVLAYGIQHPSQPNYYWLFSGSNQRITTDTAPTKPQFTAPNLYSRLREAGLNFRGYAGDYPGPAQRYQSQGDYAVRHLPWLGFQKIPAGVTIDAKDFPSNAKGFKKLPTVSFVVPSLLHDMHDYVPGKDVENAQESALAIFNGDKWLRENLAAYLKWARSHNSLLILTFDEDSTADWVTPPLTFKNPSGFTSPDLGPVNGSSSNGTLVSSGPNRITVLFAGAHVRPGKFNNGGAGITNVNVLRTIEAFYDLRPCGGQAPLARKAGITNGPVQGIFASPNPRVRVTGPVRELAGGRVQLRGMADDTAGRLAVVKVKINNGPYQSLSGTDQWSCRLVLRPGMNRIRFQAFDRDGTGSALASVDVVR